VVVGAKAIELREKLVDGLPRVLRVSLGARKAERIDFVEEQHARSVMARLLENRRAVPLTPRSPRHEVRSVS
jgi:hypothetical protein